MKGERSKEGEEGGRNETRGKEERREEERREEERRAGKEEAGWRKGVRRI